MSIELARNYLKEWDLDDRIQEFPVSSATVELAAQALGCIPARIAKSLTFLKDGRCILILAAGDARIDNRKFKDTFGVKAKMLTPEEVLAFTGHEIGGVCPFGCGPDVDVYTDISLKRFDSVYPAAGSGNSCIRLTCEELFDCSRSLEWVNVCKNWESES